MRIAAILVAAALGLGVALGDAFAAFHDDAALAGWIAVVGAVSSLALRWLAPLGLPCVVALWLCAGAAVAIPETKRPMPPSLLLHDRGPLRFEGRIIDPPMRAYGATALTLRLGRVFVGGQWRDVDAIARLWIGGLLYEASLGEVIVGRARFGPPRILDNPGSPDQARALRYAGVSVMGAVRSPNAISRIADVRDGAPWPLLDRLRATVAARLGEGTLGEGALVSAMFLGDRGGLTRADRDAFAITGLSHALAVSGQHLVIVVFFFYRALAWLLARWEWLAVRVAPRRAAAVFALLLAVAYTLFTGAPYSAVRALVMATLYLGGTLLSRCTRRADALCLGAAGIVALSPGALFDAGFQLSVLAVAGLHWVSPAVFRWLGPRPADATTLGAGAEPGRWRRVHACVARVLAATLGATAVTAPLVAMHFQYFTPLGLLGSLFVVPFLELWVLPVACLAAALPFLEDALWPAAEVGAWLMRRAMDGLLALDFVATSVPPPSMTALVLLLALVFALAHLRALAGRLVAVSAAVLLTLGWAASSVSRRMDARVRITYLSVGHGDAAVVQLPGNHAILIDGGGAIHGDFDVGRFVVAPALRALGVSRLDAVVLSHAHPDHAGGLAHILRTFDVGEVWHCGRPFGRGASGLGEALVARGVPQRVFRVGDRPAQFGAATVEVLHPLPPSDEPPYFRELGDNDNSLTVRVRLGAFSALFPGDLEADGERSLLEVHPHLTSTVLKAPHHGSRTSSTPPFLAAVAPQAAIFSVGEGSAFGFPSSEVVQRTASTGARLFQTDKDGAITVHSDGYSVSMSTRRSGRAVRWELPRSPDPHRPVRVGTMRLGSGKITPRRAISAVYVSPKDGVARFSERSAPSPAPACSPTPTAPCSSVPASPPPAAPARASYPRNTSAPLPTIPASL